MRYTVYCDESRHDGPHAHPYMAIGGLWVPSAEIASMEAAFRDITGHRRDAREIKWSKTKPATLGLHKRIANLFFDWEGAAFRAIVVDQKKVDLARYHQGDNELGFYKFYYEMLEKWILSGNEYIVALDYKDNRDPHRYTTMRTFLQNRALKMKARIVDLVGIDSASEPLVQICDLLTGAVAASCCDDLRPGSPKEALAAHIAERARFLSLKNSSLSPAFSKFNIFRIRL